MALLLLGRACRTSTLRIAALKQIPRKQVFRTFAEDGRETFKTRSARRKTLKEQAMSPSGEGGINNNLININKFL